MRRPGQHSGFSENTNVKEQFMKSKKSRWIKFAAVVTGLALTVPALMGAVTYHNAIKIFDGNKRSRMVLSQSDDPLAILEENDVDVSEYDEYEFLETGRSEEHTSELQSP